jgi:four helix bundle protein
MAVKSYRDLIVWERSLELTCEVYRLTSRFPSDERFGLTIQMRRAATSIVSNIAEGHERHSRGDFRRFVSMALGSLAELETQIELGMRLGFSDSTGVATVRGLTDQVGRMLGTMRTRLLKPQPPSPQLPSSLAP